MAEAADQSKPRMSFLSWCLLISTVANVATSATLVFIAATTAKVSVTDGYISASISNSSRYESLRVEVTNQQREPLPVRVENDVTVKTGLYSPLEVRVR
jgi:hypothetical protein